MKTIERWLSHSNGSNTIPQHWVWILPDQGQRDGHYERLCCGAIMAGPFTGVLQLSLLRGCCGWHFYSGTVAIIGEGLCYGGTVAVFNGNTVADYGMGGTVVIIVL